MPDETQQPTPEPTQPEPIPTPPVENPISESNPALVSPDKPTTETPIPPIESVPASEPSGPTEASPGPEEAIPVNNDISANEPLESAPIPENAPAPENPNITVEKHGNDVTITEVMKPEPEPKPETAQMAGNEPLDLTEEIKTKQRQENLKLANETRQEKKREKVDKILEMFSRQKEITNDEVEKLLHVSDATATRYLETLEKEGKIKQVGKTGKGVTYEKM